MDFAKLTEYIDTIPACGVPGCDLVIYKEHKPVYRHMAGYRNREKKELMRGDEVYRLYSCTKVFTTCAAMQLIERGKLHLDAPVSDYLPAYAHLTVKNGNEIHPAVRVMTVRHLMSMQSGLNYNLETPAIQKLMHDTHNLADTRQLVDAKAEDPLEFEPGSNFMYSASHDVLAAVVEAASGQRFSVYLKENIFKPLRLKTMSFSIPEEDHERLCAQYVYNSTKKTIDLCPEEENDRRMYPNFESGGGGLMGDVQDYITFIDALACNGTSQDGIPILSPEMIQLWSANQLGPQSRKSFDAWGRLGYSYALGVRTRVDVTQGGHGIIGEFGWDGAAGAWAMIDPHHHISAFYAMHVLSFNYSYDVIHPTIRSLIYEGLEK